jgi:osmotically-inducible protein OsmY
MLVGDMQLKDHIEDELSWEPSINSAAIGVGVKDAVVTISGCVDSYAEKHAAEQVVMRIRGVRSLANELEVRLPAESERRDEDIARAIAEVFIWNSRIPSDAIKAQVSNGWVTLEGSVDWDYKRKLAEQVVMDLMGVKGVSNQITIRSLPLQNDVKSRIESALKRNAELNSENIDISVKGNKVILSGAVQALTTRISAERAAWKAPGVLHVENNLQVTPDIDRSRFD